MGEKLSETKNSVGYYLKKVKNFLQFGKSVMNKKIVYKYPLHTGKVTAETLRQWSCATRYLWNRILRLRTGLYKRYKINFSYYGDHSTNKRLTILRDRYGWLEAVPNCIQQKCLQNMDAAFKNFYRRMKQGQTPGYPRFKNRSQLPGLYFPKQKFKLIEDDHGRTYLDLTKIAQHIRVAVDRPFIEHPDDEVSSCTIVYEGGRWMLNLLVVKNVGAPVKRNLPSVGLDMGVAQTVTRSDGVVHQIDTDKIKRIESRISLLQRRLSRKMGSKRGHKKSKNWIDLKRQITKKQSELAHIRQNFNHQTSRTLVDQFDRIVIEDLKIKNMSASAAGTIEEPGSMVKQKSGLNRAILRNGWFQLRTMLEYKSAWVGGKVVLVKPHYTSQTCSQCGHVDAGNRINQSKFVCKQCGYTANADINAAVNILKLSPAGSPGSASGGVGLPSR
jgi:putative transposase